MEPTQAAEKQRGDPFETEAAPWQERVATLARGGWAGDLQIQFMGVDLVETVEYLMADHLNRVYLGQR